MRDTHAAVVRDRVSMSVELDPDRIGRAFAAPLPEPAVATTSVPLADHADLVALRDLVTARARAAALDDEAVADFVLSVHEIATNSLRHGCGERTARLWRDDSWLVCELRDHGSITDPLVGRRAPASDGVGGRGIWIANHLADLVQLRSSPEGTTVRVLARVA